MVGRPPRRVALKESELPRVEAVERALSILDAFGDGIGTQSLTDLSRSTGFYPSTILRLAGSLERFGYLRRELDGRFRLGPSARRLGTMYEQVFGLSGVIRPILADLVHEVEETAAFYVREGNMRVCLFRQNGPRPLRSHLEEGSVLPLDRGAGGHVLMAYSGANGDHYDQIRELGWVASLGERDPDSAAVAVPVLDGQGRFIGALSVSGPVTRFDQAHVALFVDALKRHAQSITRVILHG
jgi:DNA-binding IclR family transcriptional regulator